MYKSIISFMFIGILFKLNAQQYVMIQAGTNITTDNNAVIVMENTSLLNSSLNTNLSNCLLMESGSINTTIGGTGSLSVKEITINKAGATLQMKGNLTIQSKVNFQSGFMDLNGNILSLAPTALLMGEKSTSRLIGDNGGFATIVVIMNNPFLQNPGNLGLSVSSSVNMGTVTVHRGHKIQTQNGSAFSIKRNYTIKSSNGPNFIGTLRFAYFDEELGLISEPLMQIYSSMNGTSWVNRGFTNKNQIQNYIESNALTSLESFTMAEPTPAIVSDPKHGLDNRSTNSIADSIQFDAHLFPNPAHENESVSLVLITNFETKGNIQIINQVGQIVNRIPFNTTAGTQNLQLNTNDLEKGIYMVHIVSDDGRKKSLKLIVE